MCYNVDNMDFDKEKRNQLIRVVIVDVISFFAVIFMVFVLVAVVKGWRLNRKLEFEQYGMVQAESLPTGAKVVADGREIAETNISKLLSASEHEIVLKKDGYDTWSKKISITSGKLLRLKYPRLFKQSRETEVLATEKDLSFFETATNHRAILYGLKESPKFKYVTNLEGDTTTTEFDVTNYTSFVSNGKFTGSLKKIIWNENSEKAVVNLVSGEASEWLLLNFKEATKSVNLTKVISGYTDKDIEKIVQEKKLEAKEAEDFTKTEKAKNSYVISEVQISDGQATRLMMLIDGKIREVNLNEKIIYETIVTDVAKFSMYGSELAFVKKLNADKKFVISIFKLRDTGEIKIDEVDESVGLNQIFVNLTEFYGEKYFNTVIGQKLRVYNTDDYPNHDSKNTSLNLALEKTLEAVPSEFYTSANGEFFMGVSGNKVMLVNLELMELLQFEHQNNTIRQLDYYLMFDVVDGKMQVYDFDHDNQRTILEKVANGFDAVINHNNRYLYYVGTSENGLQIKRDKLF